MADKADRFSNPVQNRLFTRLQMLAAPTANKLLVYQPFTAESYERLLQKEAEEKIKNEEKARRANDAFLKDGELRFGKDDEEKLLEKKDVNPDLKAGCRLKEDEYGYLPNHLLGVPLEEIDAAVPGKTFVVISRWCRKAKYIHRFSATPSFNCLTVWNPIRRVAVCIEVNQFFDLFILITILLNCLVLAHGDHPMISPDGSSYGQLATRLEFVFLGIYFFEMVIKMTAKGLFMDKYTYLRDPWNWLDLLVILSSFVAISISWSAVDSSVNISSSPSQALRIFRVLRVFKTVSIFPGLRTIVNAMLRALKMLFEMTLLMLFTMMVCSVFSVELYQGTLRQKCVLDPALLHYDPNSSIDYAHFYLAVLRNKSNWQAHGDEYKLCGNASGAQGCQAGYICQPNIGENPNYGYTNFDTFGWAMLMSFQLMTLDFWENCYFKVLATNGIWSVLFFIVAVFFGSFYLLNLMLAVVTITYEEEAERTHKELEKDKVARKKQKAATFYDLAILSTVAGDSRPNKLFRQKKRTASRNLHNILKVRKQVRNWLHIKKSLIGNTQYFEKYATATRSPAAVQANVLAAAHTWMSFARMRVQQRAQEKKHAVRQSQLDTRNVSNQTDNFPSPTDTEPNSRRRRFGVVSLGVPPSGLIPDNHLQPGESDTSRSVESGLDSPSCQSGPSSTSVHVSPETSIQMNPTPSTVLRGAGLPSSPSQTSPYVPFTELCGGCARAPSTQLSAGRQGPRLIKDQSSVQQIPPPDFSKTPDSRSTTKDAASQDRKRPATSTEPVSQKTVNFSGRPRTIVPRSKKRMLASGKPDEFLGSKEGPDTGKTSSPRRGKRGSSSSHSIDDRLVRGIASPPVPCRPDSKIPSVIVTGTDANSTSWEAYDSDDNGSPRRRIRDQLNRSQNAGDDGDDAPASSSNKLSPPSAYPKRQGVKPTLASTVDLLRFGTLARQDYSDVRSVTTDSDKIEESEDTKSSSSSSAAAESCHDMICDRLKQTVCWKILSPCVTCLCSAWENIRLKTFIVVSDPFFSVFINFAIVVNTVCMSLEHDGMSQDISELLEVSSQVFTVLYTVEAVLKLIGYGVQGYFKVAWNVFDFVIVVISLVTVALVQTNIGKQGSMPGFLVFRAFRLLRVLKLAQVWPAMNTLLTIISRALGSVGNLTIILLVILYSFAVIGLQVFNGRYTKATFPDGVPRWNFSDFPHSFMMVFRVLCGEWIEPLWDCMRINDPNVDGWCMIVFFPTLIFGNFVVLNLFLALLLNAFGSGDLKSQVSEQDAEVGHFEVVKRRCKRLLFCLPGYRHRLSTVNALKIHLPEQDVLPVTDLETQLEILRKRGLKQTDSTVSAVSVAESRKNDMPKHFSTVTSTDEKIKRRERHRESKRITLGEVSPEKRTQLLEEGPPPCWFPVCYKYAPACCGTLGETRLCKCLHRIREMALPVVENDIFDAFILTIILISSIALAFEDYYLIEKPEMVELIKQMNVVFSFLFVVEMLLRWIANGFHKYFTSPWNLLDFVVVVVSILTVVNDHFDLRTNDALAAVNAFRTFRALRPLRAISRVQGMKIVVNSLMHAIPAILNVFLVCMVFWLIFSIMGVQFFAGKFWKCIDADHSKVYPSEIANKSECIARAQDGYRWVNSKINFDDIFQSFLALFQMATFEGWMEIMEDAVDATQKDVQPVAENSMSSYIFFVFFIICGSFFSLNLVVGVIIDNFNVLKKRYEGSYLDAFLTANQRNYYQTLKKMSTRRPQKTIKRPENKFQQILYDLALSNVFELLVLIVVFINLIVCAMHYFRMSCLWRDILEMAEVAFTTFFLLEAFAKIIGLRSSYFFQPCHLYDFLVAMISVLCSASLHMSEMFGTDAIYVRSVSMSPTFLRLVRIFRIGRVLRHMNKVAKGIRKLVFALVISLPACLNIMALLGLCMFIYAIVGMFLFSHVKLTGVLSEQINFRTFLNTVMLLLSVATAAGWNEILAPLMITPPDCNITHYKLDNGTWLESEGGECGLAHLAVPYMVSYIVITYLIIINMYIAIILENYNQAHHQEEIGVTEDDFDMFYSVWERYDPRATQFIYYNQLSDFVDDLESPLGILKPNEIALVSFNLPILTGDRIHCLDILLALVKNVITDVEESEEMLTLREQMTAKFASVFPHRQRANVVSTTMERKKRDVAARTLQRAWLAVKTRQAMKIFMTFTVAETVRRTSSSPMDQTSSVELLRKNLVLALDMYFTRLLQSSGQRLSGSWSFSGSVWSSKSDQTFRDNRRRLSALSSTLREAQQQRRASRVTLSPDDPVRRGHTRYD